MMRLLLNKLGAESTEFIFVPLFASSKTAISKFGDASWLGGRTTTRKSPIGVG